MTGASNGVTMNGSYSTSTPTAGTGNGSAAPGVGVSQLTNMGVPGSPATSGIFNSSSSKTKFSSIFRRHIPFDARQNKLNRLGMGEGLNKNACRISVWTSLEIIPQPAMTLLRL